MHNYEKPRHNPPRYRWCARAKCWLLVGLRYDRNDPPRNISVGDLAKNTDAYFDHFGGDKSPH